QHGGGRPGDEAAPAATPAGGALGEAQGADTVAETGPAVVRPVIADGGGVVVVRLHGSLGNSPGARRGGGSRPARPGRGGTWRHGPRRPARPPAAGTGRARQ